MPNIDNINATIEVLRRLAPGTFSMKYSQTCIANATVHAGIMPDQMTCDFLGLRDAGDSSNESVTTPPNWWTEPELYPLPVAIRMLEIARDEDVIDWQRARMEIAMTEQNGAAPTT